VASVTVPASSRTWQIVFEGIVGTGIQGDAAIDDYSITAGPCSPINGMNKHLQIFFFV
jgi:hypothetical protein